ncbi:hypothetical protein [Ancylobacter defluvii]|uniref:Uncharacterized protein n=1 Tax=Ancylobacter defluvii TaxID=1282440 RepID=A0A9W6K2D1_9HYPH|nr:hypothetical protein [Ancylobacter defluvii]MBS7586392.1 hypothetical protein [Ancylobacter defluvii]GLK85673.1 hypothetical protein GCM10017653_37430 [Ancylobacter defluvii]
MVATPKGYVVKDGAAGTVNFRSYVVDGLEAQAPFVPEIGEKADPAWSGAGPSTVLGVLKGLFERASTGAARNALKDSTGALFYPDDCAVTAVTRDASGNLLTQTISDGTTSWVQTITRDANGNMSALSKWERQ